MNSLGELPIGTVTFLFTDIEGSTQLLKRLGGERYREALEDHQRILREAFAEHGGHEIDTQGDSFFVAFRRAKDAVSAATACQRRLAEHAWPEGVVLRVRMGIHTGEPSVGGERYVGMGVHRAARICAAGHGGQVLVSQTARELLRDDPIPDVSLSDLGEHHLKDLDESERLYQLVAVGLQEQFRPLKTAAPTPFAGREGELAEAAVEQMTRRWTYPGRRMLLLATLAAAAVGTAIGVLATQGGGSSAGASLAPNAVGLIDSESGDIVEAIDIGGEPGEIAVAADAVWVTNTTADTVSRIDPATNDVRQTIRIGSGPEGVAVGGGAVWVANGLDGTVSRIDPQTNQVVQTIAVGNGPNGVALGYGAVWVTNSSDGTVSRIDVESGRVTKTVPVVVGAAGVAVGFQRVWIASPSSASVVILDSSSGRVLSRIGVGAQPEAVSVGPDAVWVANRADGTVSKIDPRAVAVTSTVQVGRQPGGIAVGPESVWVANERDGTLSRIDPSTGVAVKTVQLENSPAAVALVADRLYVGVRSTGEEHRGGELRVLLGSPPDSLDPAIAYAPESWSALSMTNDGLIGFRKVGGVEGTQLVPDLGVALPTPTDGGKTHTFELRPGIVYSNGARVQPEDFRRAIERLFELGSPAVEYYTRILGTEGCRKGRRCKLTRGIVTDRATRTITFRLSAPDADFLAKLALPFAYPVPAGTPGRDVGSQPVPATGPYRITTYDKSRKMLRLVRNPRFREWSADAQPDGFPDKITFSWRVVDVERRVRAVERGAADVFPGGLAAVPEEVLNRLAVRYPGRLRVSLELGTFYFFLNTRVAPFDDVRVRRAVSLALDRAELARRLGRLGTTTCRILPPNFRGYRPTCPYGAGGVAGLDRARALVRQSGTLGASVTVWTLTHAGREAAPYMVSLLESLGFRARLREIDDPTSYFERVADSRIGVQVGWAAWHIDFPSIAGFLRPLASCSAFVPAAPERTTNLAEFCDRSIDAQMNRAAAEQVHDPAAATILWQRAEDAVLAQAPIVPAYNRTSVSFVSERVGNYQYNPQWGVLHSQLWVK